MRLRAVKHLSSLRVRSDNPALYRLSLNILSVLILHMIIIRFLALKPFLFGFGIGQLIVCKNEFMLRRELKAEED